jgi:predicted nucleic acid-binding protein
VPSNSVFLDTNGWLALLNGSDSLHQIADSVWRELGRQRRPILLTDYIIAETGNGMAKTIGRAAFVEAVKRMRQSPRAKVVRVDEQILDRALALYSARQDKTWGLVDCVSFVLMQDEKVTDAFTSDHHFEQAGIRCLLPVY